MARVVVVGSIGVDLVAYAPRLPARGETVLGDRFARFPGANGAFMRETLAARGVDIAGVETVAAAATQVALIMVGGGDNQIVVVPGANMHIDANRIGAL